MPKAIYENIYKELKNKIDHNEYKEGAYLPSESTLIQIYNCSRNTIRRAISHLVLEGYVQPHRGKGVRVIYSSPRRQDHDFLAIGVNGFSTTAAEYGFTVKTKVITFTDMMVDDKLSDKTGFPVGTEIYFIQRVRSLNNVPKMVDTNLLRKDIVTGLDQAAAEKSLFDYFTKTLGMEITTIKRKVTVERVTPFDERYLLLDGYNCLAVLTSRCYNQNGIQFEYTESRNRPDIFRFNSVVTKSLKPN